MKYRQSKEFNLTGFIIGSVIASVLGFIYFGDPPFVFKMVVSGGGGWIGGITPKMYGIIIHGDYW